MWTISILREQRGTAILIALMLTAILSLLGTSLLDTGATEMKIACNQESAARAFFLAEAGLQHAAAVFNRQGVEAALALTGAEHGLGDGSYRLDVAEVDFPGQSRIKISATGTCRGMPRRLQAEFFRVFVDFRPAGALTILNEDPTIRFEPGADPIIDGRDHSLPGDFHCAGERCESELTGMPAAAGLHSLTAAPLAGNGICGEPPHRIGPPAASADDWRGLARDLNGEANPGPVSLGNREAPEVTRITGHKNFDVPMDGAGILVIEAGATLRIDAPFHFEGLVLLLDGARLDCSAAATDIFGALVMAGDDAAFEFQSGFRLLFSRQALSLTERWLPAPHYTGTKLASWHDLDLL